MSTTKTHPAIVTVTAGGPLEVHQLPTPTPEGNEVKVLVEYTASTPLDLHQHDGHFLVKPPQVLGDGVAGTVIEVGPETSGCLKPGDKVFGFAWRNVKEKCHQLYCVTTENLLGKLPKGHTMAEAVTLPNNFVTVWHTFTYEFGFEFPWSLPDGRPKGYTPPGEQTDGKWILIWGGSSSCGMFALQVLKYYGYKNVIAIASAGHHEKLKDYGAAKCFDYRGGTDATVQKVREFIKSDGGEVVYILDCIGSQNGSVKPCSEIAEAKGCKVAILLPVIVKDAAVGVKPEYTFDVESSAKWKEGVIPSGVRTHFWLDNKTLAETLETEIMPWALATGVVEPNEQVMVEGKTLLERAENAMSMLREKKVSGGRLVWRIAEDDQVKEALAGIKQ